MSETQAPAHMPAISIKGSDIQRGLWNSLNKLANDASLDFTVKARVAAIYRELDKQTRTMQEKYEESRKALKWEHYGEAGKEKCLEPEKMKALDKEFFDAEILIPGRKLKAEKLGPNITAGDILQLEPLLEA